MKLDDMLSQSAVIGAAGKMGRGIALLLLREVIKIDLTINREKPSVLFLIDNSTEGLSTLLDYLDTQMLKFAEKNIVQLREWYAKNTSLIDNGEIIEAFTKDCRKRIRTSTDITCLKGCHIVFEAVFEDLKIKSDIYSQLKVICPADCCYFTNTSSIPISAINDQNELKGRIIGFHFYNPPAVQKLVELISMDANSPELVNLSKELISRLGKLMVPSNDQAGFIGNGHFIREGLYYIKQLSDFKLDPVGSILATNSIIQKYLIRPMGMFQLIDYVGIDVFKMICSTMDNYLEEDFSCKLIDDMISSGAKGGQYGDGSQKNGFFEYTEGNISGVYCLKKSEYISIDKVTKSIKSLTTKFGAEPKSWKELSRDRNKNEYLKEYFHSLSNNNSPIARKAISYLLNSKKICSNLVKNKVANTNEDVNAVMTNGFFHLYGPNSALLSSLKKEA